MDAVRGADLTQWHNAGLALPYLIAAVEPKLVHLQRCGENYL